jgi:pyruvate ferredoxin oxidoreductase delta subunit
MKIKQGSTWRDVPMAGNILEPGTSVEIKTGAWRQSMKPRWYADRCTQCLNCWYFCPDVAIRMSDEGKVVGIDYDYCKGCGICADVCPEKANAIEMIPESEEL